MSLADLPLELVILIGQQLSVDDVFTLRRMLLPPELQFFQSDDILKAAFVAQEGVYDFNPVRLDLSTFTGSIEQELREREAMHWQHKAGYPCKKIGVSRESRPPVDVFPPCGSIFGTLEYGRFRARDPVDRDRLRIHDLIKNRHYSFSSDLADSFVLTQTLLAFSDTTNVLVPAILHVQSLDKLASASHSHGLEIADSFRTHKLPEDLRLRKMAGHCDRLIILFRESSEHYISLYDFATDEVQEHIMISGVPGVALGNHKIVAGSESFQIFSYDDEMKSYLDEVDEGETVSYPLSVSRYNYDLELLERWHISLYSPMEGDLDVTPTGLPDILQIMIPMQNMSDEVPKSTYVVLHTKEHRIMNQRDCDYQAIWKDRLYRSEGSDIKVIALLPTMVEHRDIGTISCPGIVQSICVDDSFMIVSYNKDSSVEWTAFTFDASIDTDVEPLSTAQSEWYWQPTRRARDSSRSRLGILSEC